MIAIINFPKATLVKNSSICMYVFNRNSKSFDAFELFRQQYIVFSLFILIKIINVLFIKMLHNNYKEDRSNLIYFFL